jgi:hypothetical protein
MPRATSLQRCSSLPTPSPAATSRRLLARVRPMTLVGRIVALHRALGQQVSARLRRRTRTRLVHARSERHNRHRPQPLRPRRGRGDRARQAARRYRDHRSGPRADREGRADAPLVGGHSHRSSPRRGSTSMPPPVCVPSGTAASACRSSPAATSSRQGAPRSNEGLGRSQGDDGRRHPRCRGRSRRPHAAPRRGRSSRRPSARTRMRRRGALPTGWLPSDLTRRARLRPHRTRRPRCQPVGARVGPVPSRDERARHLRLRRRAVQPGEARRRAVGEGSMAIAFVHQYLRAAPPAPSA